MKFLLKTGTSFLCNFKWKRIYRFFRHKLRIFFCESYTLLILILLFFIYKLDFCSLENFFKRHFVEIIINAANDIEWRFRNLFYFWEGELWNINFTK